MSEPCHRIEQFRKEISQWKNYVKLLNEPFDQILEAKTDIYLRDLSLLDQARFSVEDLLEHRLNILSQTKTIAEQNFIQNHPNLGRQS